MKIKILTIAIFLVTLTGCDKPPKPTITESSSPTITAQFEQSDERIGNFLNRLEDPNTSQDARIQILCKDYPTEYKENYMPALLKLSPKIYTKTELQSDLNYVLNSYKADFNIKC